jgi:outer membrane protein assembly factor BamB
MEQQQDQHTRDDVAGRRRRAPDPAPDPAHGDDLKRRDVIKILRNVGVVCSAVVGVVKVADMAHVFGGGKGSPPAAEPMATTPTATATKSSFDGAPPKSPVAAPFPIDAYSNAPVVVGDIALVCTLFGTLYALNLRTGQQQWQQSLKNIDGSVSGQQQTPVVSGTSVYVSAADCVRVFDLAKGTPLRMGKYPTGIGPDTDMVISGEDGVLTILAGPDGDAPYSLLKMDPATGAVKGKPAKITGTDGFLNVVSGRPAYAPGWIVFADDQTGAYIVNTKTAAATNVKPAQLTLPRPKIDPVTGMLYFVAGAFLYAYTLSGPKPSLKWTFATPTGVALASSIAAGDGVVYVADDNTTVYAVAQADGKGQALTKLDSLYNRLAYADGTLYAAHHNGAGVAALKVGAAGKPTTTKWFCKLPTPVVNGQANGLLHDDPIVGKSGLVVGVEDLAAGAAGASNVLHVIPL